MKDANVVQIIAGAIVTIAGLIFAKKQKTKVTRRKKKTVNTNQNQLTKQN